VCVRKRETERERNKRRRRRRRRRKRERVLYHSDLLLESKWRPTALVLANSALSRKTTAPALRAQKACRLLSVTDGETVTLSD